MHASVDRGSWQPWALESPRRCPQTAKVLEVRRLIEEMEGATIQNVDPSGVTFTLLINGRIEWAKVQPSGLGDAEGLSAVVLSSPESPPVPLVRSFLPSRTYNFLLEKGFMALPKLEPRR